MIDVNKACRLILRSGKLTAAEAVALQEATGRALREDITADRDFPPFDRVSMDGVAINYQAWQNGKRIFTIEGLQLAGEAPKKLTDPLNCLEIMTGAILPENTDTVIRYEDVGIDENRQPMQATIQVESITPGQNVHPRGADRKKGDLLISSGFRITPAEIAVAAAVGKAEVLVSAIPRIAVISSGDELVPVDEQPEPHQIRQSNAHMLQSALKELQIVSDVFHLPDQKRLIEDRLVHILANYDILLLSGGVSKGKADFVPEVMEALSVQKVFHSVAQRPGKPFWFGKGAKGQTVFAFPGNPVSTFVGFHRYFKPYLNQILGLKENPVMKAVLAEDFTFKPDLTCFLQVRTAFDTDGRLKAFPLPGKGSGDFANLLLCNGFLELPRGQSLFKSGEVFDYLPFRDTLSDLYA